MSPMMVGSTPDLSIITEQLSHSNSGSPDEARGDESSHAKGQKLKRRFTFTRGKSPSKTAARRSSEAVASSVDFSSSSMMFRRKASTPTPKAVTLLSKRDSSDDSSINWSIPSDLPGVVEGRVDRGSMENMFADADEIRSRCRSTPTIAERRESESSIAISEMRISQNGPMTAEVAVQVDSGEQIFQFPDIISGTSVGHYDLLQAAANRRSPPESRSMPQSPYCTRGTNYQRPMGGVHRIVTWGKENGEQRIASGNRGQKRTVRVEPSCSNGHHSIENVSNMTCLFKPHVTCSTGNYVPQL
jgi:hypothetical protein